MKISCTKNDLLNGVNIVLKAVPAKTTMSILECILITAANGQIKLTANDMELGIETLIKGDKANFNLVGKSGDDFSYLPDIEKNEFITISQFTLKEVIRQTIFSIADNDNNKIMTGELFEINENQLKVVSLDGHRISIRKIELKESYASKKVVVPGKTLNEISKILPGSAEEDVAIYLTDNHII